MTNQEKVLYHQIHPLKLLTDIGVAILSFSLLWQHQRRAALLVQIIPAPVVSGILIRWADLEPQKQSAFGQYIGHHMTPAMQTMRLAGTVVMSLGAWYRRPGLLVAGSSMVLFGWLRGKLLP